ncbi:MAG TPA: LemA family protein [Spirochaetota bacterium]|nr:LemA family protein [Spirochaetota bacterium]HSA15928.1 LemA family protein [Spirochaetota bacterium]
MKGKRFKLGMFVIMAAALLTSCGYNTMQALEEEVFGAWGDLEATLQRRADLIPNLVSTVKGYASHEKETLTGVIEARAKATQVTLKPQDLSNPKAVQQFQQAQGEISSALARLMVVVERYPNLKADRHFSDLMNQLEGTENRINVARQRYNQAVKDFNFSIRKFPYNITNNILLNLERKEYFEADAEAKKAPKVEF